MPLALLGGPGCDDLKADAVEELDLEPGAVTISVGKMVESILGTAAVPSETPAVLRVAMVLRTVAIKQARERGVSGVVLTSNGSRQDLEKLRQQVGADEIRIVAITEAEACSKIAKLVPPGERRQACELGIKSRWFGRYSPAPGDRPIRPRSSEEREAIVEKIIRRSIELELREEQDGPRLRGTILQEGRAGSTRAELFAPNSVLWPEGGISIRTEHRGRELAKAVPVRYPGGEIRIDTPATPELRDAVNSGKRFMSVEFSALDELRTQAGVREITQALVKAAALTRVPEYAQTSAEVRTQKVSVWL